MMIRISSNGLHLFRIGESQFFCLSKNVSGGHTFYKSVLTCSYKEGDSYKSTSNIDYYDLPAASILFARAANWIAYQIEKESEGQRGD